MSNSIRTGTRGRLADIFLRSPSLHLSLILLAALSAYSNTFHAPFEFDDSHVILDNPRIRSLHSIPSLFLDPSGSIGSRPLSLSTFALNYAISGTGSTTSYHVFNFTVHVLNAMLLYALILRTARALGRAHSQTTGPIALICALVLAVHPMHTEAVTYIVSRSELLNAFFVLSGLHIFLMVTGYPEGDRRRKHIVGVPALFMISVLGMTSRENFIAFPLLMFAFDLAIVSNGNWRKLLSNIWLHLALLPGALYLLWLVMGRDFVADKSAWYGITSSTPWQYTITEFRVHWSYLKMLILPVGQNIDHDYRMSQTLLEPAAMAAFIGWLCIWGLGVYTLRRRPAVSMCVLWFVIMLLPTTIVPVVDVFFEHRVYTASIGPSVLAVIGLFHIKNSERS